VKPCVPCSSVRTTTARGPLWQSHGSFHSPARNHSGAFPKCILASFRRPLPACPPTARTTSKPRDDAKTRLDPGLTLATLCDLGFGALGWRLDPCACLFLPRLRAAWGSLSFTFARSYSGEAFVGDPTFFSTLSVITDPRVRHVVCSSVGECSAHGAHQGSAASRYPRGRQSSAFRQESSDYSVHCSGMLWFTMLCIASEA
jgi:hypothetical protein